MTFGGPSAILSRPLAARRLITIAGATALLCALLAYSAGTAGPVHIQPALASSSPWLDRLNAWRAGSAVPALTENSTYDSGDAAHGLYMVKNDLVTHYETPGVPYYTAAGDAAARASNIYVSSSTSTTDVQAIDWWMGAPFHAMGMMDPRLAQTGFGSYREVKSGWEMGAALNVLSGNPFTGGGFPVYFPGNGTTEPLTSYSGNEFPDPLQACSGYAVPTGLPVFVELGGNVTTTATASSFTGDGVALPHCVIDSNSPNVGSSLTYRGGVVVIPRAPLVAGVHYTVGLTVNGASYTWSFSVGTLTPGIWTANYDLTNAPTSWTPGQTQTFNVTITNTSNQTWPHGGNNAVMLDIHFTTLSGGSPQQSHWLTNQSYPLPSDLPPAASVTLSVSVTAPSSGGAMWLEAEMFKNQQFWFGSFQAVPVAVALPRWTATYAVTSPAAWVVGQTQSVSVTLTNTGNQTWPHGGSNAVMLDMHFTTVSGGSAQQSHWLTNQSYPLPGDVAPAASITVSVSVTAPSSGGGMWLEAELLKNQQFWFAQAQPTSVTVYNHWQATIDLSAAPTSWNGGQAQTFSVTLHNVGDQTWPHGGTNAVMLDINFSTSAGGDAAKYCCWLTSQTYLLPADVAPGGSVTLSVSVSPPSGGGTYYLEAELLKNQQFWFPTWSYVPATVVGAWSAVYTVSSPATWFAGQTQSASVTLTNTGGQTWPHGGANAVMLDMHFTTASGGSAQQSHWLTSQSYVLPSDIAPGGSVTLTVSVTAPSSGGAMWLEAELFKNQQFWFAQAKATPVTVYNHWQATIDLSAAPTSWTAGQAQSFNVTLHNVGDQTWPSGGTNLVLLDINFSTSAGGDAAKYCCWLTSQTFVLPSDVAPGGSVTLSVNVTPPSSTGTYYLEAELLKNQQFWFPTWSYVTASVG